MGKTVTKISGVVSALTLIVVMMTHAASGPAQGRAFDIGAVAQSTVAVKTPSNLAASKPFLVQAVVQPKPGQTDAAWVALRIDNGQMFDTGSARIVYDHRSRQFRFDGTGGEKTVGSSASDVREANGIRLFGSASDVEREPNGALRITWAISVASASDQLRLQVTALDRPQGDGLEVVGPVSLVS